MRDEHIEFFKTPFIEQQLNAFARGQLTFGVLRGDAARAAAQTGRFAARFEFFKNIFHGRCPLWLFGKLHKLTKISKQSLEDLQTHIRHSFAN